VGVASTLRAEGRTVDLILESEKKAKWVFKHASRTEARYCVIVAGDEYANGEVVVKDLASGEQGVVRVNALGDWAKDAFQS